MEDGAQLPSLVSEDAEPEQDLQSVTDHETASSLSLMPSHLQNCYDGLILYSDDDENDVIKMKHSIFEDPAIKQLDTKIVLFNDTGLGHTEVHSLELGIEVCTVVFLFVTKNFCNNAWTKFSSDACLSESLRNPEKRWNVVPIFTEPKNNCSFKIPTSLCSLKGVQYSSDGGCNKKCIDQIKRHLESKIFIRKEREMELPEKRKKWIVNRKQKEATRKSESQPNLQTGQPSRPDSMHTSPSAPVDRMMSNMQLHSESIPSLQDPSDVSQFYDQLSPAERHLPFYLEEESGSSVQSVDGISITSGLEGSQASSFQSSERSEGTIRLSSVVETDKYPSNPSEHNDMKTEHGPLTTQEPMQPLLARPSNEPVSSARSPIAACAVQGKNTDLHTRSKMTKGTSGVNSDSEPPQQDMSDKSKMAENLSPDLHTKMKVSSRGDSSQVSPLETDGVPLNEAVSSQIPQTDPHAERLQSLARKTHQPMTEKPVGIVAPIKTGADEDQTERKAVFEEPNLENRNYAQQILMGSNTLNQFRQHPDDCSASENEIDQVEAALVCNNGADASGDHGRSISLSTSADDATRSYHAEQNNNQFESVSTNDSAHEPGREDTDTIHGYSPHTPRLNSYVQSDGSPVDPPCFGEDFPLGDNVNRQSQPLSSGDNPSKDRTVKSGGQKCIIV